MMGKKKVGQKGSGIIHYDDVGKLFSKVSPEWGLTAPKQYYPKQIGEKGNNIS